MPGYLAQQPVAGPSALADEARMLIEAGAAEVRESEATVDALLGELDSRFQYALNWHNSEIRPRLNDCKLRRKGKYSPDKLARIKEQGGTDLYFNQTATKCRALRSWIEDLLTVESSPPFILEPTPLADLPPSIIEQVNQRVDQELLARPGLPFADIQALALAIMDEKETAYQKEAEERAEKMEKYLVDLLVEGGFEEAMAEFIQYFSIYPYAIMKGPVWHNEMHGHWDVATEEFIVEERPVPRWYAVSNFNMYWAPNSRTLQRGDVFETGFIDGSELARQRGQDGWDAERVDRVLAEGPMRDRVEQTEHERLDARDPEYAGDQYPVRYCWSCLQGKLLTDWVDSINAQRAPEDAVQIDPMAYYDVNAVLVNKTVVKVILNPDKLGRRPYFHASFDPEAGSIVGDALPEVMADCQDVSLPAHRALVNNMALASGPLVIQDVDCCDEKQLQATKHLSPWQRYLYSGNKSLSTRPPIDFHDIPSKVGELLEVTKHYEELSEERTNIPRYGYGDDNASGAATTATGLNILMENLGKGIKSIAQELHRGVIAPLVVHLHEMVLQLRLRPDLHGDARVRPRGILARIVEEQQVLGQQDFLNQTNNDVDLRIIGLKGRAKILREIAVRRGLGDVVPSEQELEAQLMAEAEAMAMQAGAEMAAEEEKGSDEAQV